MAGDRTAIVARGEGRNTPAAAHVASLALAGRASVASSLHRAARLATASEHADGLAYPWHRRPPPTLAALRAALRAAWLSGDMDRAMLERSSSLCPEPSPALGSRYARPPSLLLRSAMAETRTS